MNTYISPHDVTEMLTHLQGIADAMARSADAHERATTALKGIEHSLELILDTLRNDIGASLQ